MNTILIISPNAWGNLQVSKHNYAIELAKQGNKVYFINPPNRDPMVKNYQIYPIDEVDNLYIINIFLPKIRVVDFLRYRFGITQILDFYLLQLFKKISKQENLFFYQIWNFDPNLHGYFNRYLGTKKIFFIADQIKLNAQKRSAKKVDAVISVANEILQQFKMINKNCFLINHGLNKHYENAARKKLKALEQQNINTIVDKRIQVGYIGNLLMSFLDELNLKKTVLENPNVDFHFWGAYSKENNNLLATYNASIYNTVQWIKENCKNTHFYGVKKASEIVKELDSIDVFMYINSSVKDDNGGANSHKILEYLSTGKVIISTYLSYYSELAFFPMTGKGEEDNYTKLFSSVINNLEAYNSVVQQTKRVHYALENTYEKNIQKINQFLQ